MKESDSISDSKYRLGTIDLEHPSTTHDFQIILTGTKKKVLEFGPASGYISEILRKNGCHVTAIEINSTYAREAEKVVDRIIIGDAETLNLNDVLDSEKYDVILMGDFLEHLKDPTQLLKKIRGFLAQNGYIVCSIPNIAHAVIRLKLLNGEFRYQPTGLLDESHLRFFTLDTILTMLESSGYSMMKLHRAKEDVNLAYRTDLKHYTIPKELMESILRDPEATTYQYVFSAIPTSDTNTNTTEWLMEFSKDVTTERLNEILLYYKENLVEILEKRLQEKESQISELQMSLKESQKMLDDIHKSFTWKMLRRYDNTIGKIIGSKKKN